MRYVLSFACCANLAMLIIWQVGDTVFGPGCGCHPFLGRDARWGQGPRAFLRVINHIGANDGISGHSMAGNNRIVLTKFEMNITFTARL